MPRGVGLNWLYDEARLQNRILTPQALAVQMKSRLNFWWSADWLNVDASGLVSGAIDLTGNENNGVQSTAANRLSYFASDRMFGGRPSFGSTTITGARHLAAPSALAYRWHIFSCYYKDGVDNTFDSSMFFTAGTGNFGSPRVMGLSGTATLVNTDVFTSTLSRGGGVQSNTVLPMPATVCAATPGALVGPYSLQVGGSTATPDRVLVGAFRHFVSSSAALTNNEISLIEGVIAWDDGTPLVASHRFANRPPLIGD